MLLLEETRGKLIEAMSELVLERLGVSAEAISEFCRRWSITELALFGSALRRDFREDSDVDVLLTFQQGCDPELRDIAAMEEELQSLFGRKVDLVIVAERNILVHNYRGVVEEKIWQIALSAVPALIEQLEPLIAAPPGLTALCK